MKKIPIAASLVILASGFLFFLGCRSDLIDLPSTDSQVPSQASAVGPTGSIELSLDSSSRTIRPSDPLSYTIASYSIAGSGPSGASFPATALTDATFVKAGLSIGTWLITVQGLNAGSHVIAQKTVSVEVSSGGTSRTAVTLDRAVGSGTVDVTVNWMVMGDYDEVVGTLTPSGGSSQNASLTISGTGPVQAQYTAAQSAGNYLLILKLKKTGLTIDTVVEAVQVYDGYTSSAAFNRSYSLPPSTYAYSSATPTYTVDFQGAQSLNLTVTNAVGKSVYLVKGNVAGVASTGVGSAASQREVVPYSQSLASEAPVYTPDPDRVQRWEHAEAAAFNAKPPLQTMPSQRSSLPGLERNDLVIYGSGDPSLTVGSSTKTFWVENASGTWIQVTATLRAIGQYCYIWVNNANYNNSSAVNNDNLITTAQVNTLKAKFDGTSGNSYTDGIFKNVTNIFGYEYGGGSGGDGGRDADQHVAILVYDIDYDYSSNQTGGVLGYFWGKDYYSQATVDSWGNGWKTNYSEMFYIDSHFTDKYSNMIVSTLAHEYQHMIHFNRKTLGYSLSSPTWFNEMCSMVAEDLVLANIGLDPTADGAIGRLNEFSYHYTESGVIDWLSGNDVLKSYASAFAFGAYLERNYGGAALFSSIAGNDTTGDASITAALAVGGYTVTFTDTFTRYGESLVFTDKPSGSSVKTLKQAVTRTVGSISYTAVSVDFATIQQLNMASGWVSGAYGPRIYAPSDAVVLRPYGTSIHSKTTWQNLTGPLAIALTAPADPNVRFYIMVK